MTKMTLSLALLSMLSVSVSEAALLYHLTFDEVDPGANSGTAGAISWGSAPTAPNLVTSMPGMGNAYNTANNKPWTNDLANAALTFNEVTISFWNNGGTTNWDDYISLGTTGANLKLERTSSGTVALYQVGTTVPSFNSVVSTTNVDSGWHLITLTLSEFNNESILYIDGVEESSTTWAGSATEIDQFQLASELGNSGRAITTTLDDVRIYNNALSASEVAALVPEPSSTSLLGLGVASLLLRRKRR